MNKNNNKQPDDKIDFIARAIVENSSKIENIKNKMDNFVTKDEHQEVMGGIDTLIKFAKKKDEELTMMSHGMKRMNDEIDKLKKATVVI